MTPSRVCRTCGGNRVVPAERKDSQGKTVVEKVTCPGCRGSGQQGYSIK